MAEWQEDGRNANPPPYQYYRGGMVTWYSHSDTVNIFVYKVRKFVIVVVNVQLETNA
jgi:hypothetical protein